jgi:hypothetical protein
VTRNYSLQKLVSPAVLLYTYLIITQFARGIYLASGIELPPAFTLVYSAGLLWAVGWWLWKDSRKLNVAWVYDMGFFLSVAWPLIMPYYFLKTRGAKGLLLILAFIVVYIGSALAGMGLALLLIPRTS